MGAGSVNWKPNLKILFIQKSAGRGGSKLSLLETLSVLRKEEGALSWVVCGEEGPFVEQCVKMGVRVLQAELPEWRKLSGRWRFGRAMRGIADRLAGEGLDYVISNEMWWAPHAAALAGQLGCRSAVILRDGIATVKKARKYRLTEQDRILAVSTAIARGLTEDDRLAPKIFVVFNSVQVGPGGVGLAGEMEERLGRYKDVKRWILVMGKVGSRKNQVDAIRVLRRLLDAGWPDLGLILAGDIEEEYGREVRREIVELRLEERVALLGNVEDVGSVYRLSELVLLTSGREGLPRSLVEGLMLGKPCFSYPCEGVDDIFGEHLEWFVSEPDPNSMAGKIGRFLGQRAAVLPVLEEACGRVGKRFSSSNHLAMLKGALEGRRDGGSPWIKDGVRLGKVASG